MSHNDSNRKPTKTTEEEPDQNGIFYETKEPLFWYFFLFL